MTIYATAAATPIWKRFWLAILSRRGLATALLGLAALLAFRFWTRPSFEQTVAAIERLGGNVQTSEHTPTWGQSWIARFIPQGLLRFEPEVSVELPGADDRPNHESIMRWLPRFRRLRRLVIHHSSITDEDLEFLDRGSELRLFDVQSERLRGECLRFLRSHHELQTVVLVSKSLDDSLAAGLQALPDSTVLLCLNGKGVTDEKLESARHLLNLMHLNLVETSVTGSAFKALPSLPNLHWVYLDRSPISDDGLRSLLQLCQPTYLFLDDTPVTDAGVRELGKLPLLSILSLDGTTVTGTCFSEPGRFANLSVLSLSRTPIDDDSLVRISDLPHLRQLSVDRTAITEAGISFLGRHSEMWKLSLSGNRINGTSFGQITLPDLNTLDLSGTEIRDSDLSQLKAFPQLEVLILKNTKLTDAAIEQLNRLPGLRCVLLNETGVTADGLSRLNSNIKLELLPRGIH